MKINSPVCSRTFFRPNFKKLEILSRILDEKSAPFVVAELSGNHGGGLDKALKLVSTAKEAGADVIKLQTYRPDTITVKGTDDRFMLKTGLWKGRLLHELYEQAMTPWEWHPLIAKEARNQGMICFSSPFDESAVDFLEESMQPALYKVASFEINHIPLLEEIGKTKKPVIVSTGTANIKDIDFNDGDVLVTEITDPDWEPIMKKASAIITNKGGRTCHAAIVAREMGVPAIVGTENGTEVLFNGEEFTVSCAEGDVGKVYEGIVPFKLKKTKLDNLPTTKTPIMLNVASPDLAFKFAQIPNAGVGLAREEFIINNYIQAHPLALLKHKELEDEELSEKIRVLTRGFKDEETFFIKRLSYGVAKIASAFYPKQAIVRLSDFKSNEYYNLLGGSYFEPTEENPMIGWRGASRYYSKQYEYAFGMECKAIKRVRDKMGLTNVTIMIPFCRTVEELQKVYKVMKKYGLERGKDGLQVYLMAELPSNILMAEEFAEHIDGFSIGSNDLTQLTLGLDRDSSLVAHIYDERNPAVKRSISNLIKVAKQTKTKVGICGQGPSDYPDFAQFLVEEGIDTISVTPDSMLKTIKAIAKIENK